VPKQHVAVPLLEGVHSSLDALTLRCPTTIGGIECDVLLPASDPAWTSAGDRDPKAPDDEHEEHDPYWTRSTGWPAARWGFIHLRGCRVGGRRTVNIVAYGSLMHRPSLESTLRRPASLTRMSLPGWRRVFNAPFDGYSYLNLRPASGAIVEAAYFELDSAELGLFDEREAGSELVEVIPACFAFVWPMAYCRELPVLRSYIDVCRRGADKIGIDFINGTDWPGVILDDSVDPIYR